MNKKKLSIIVIVLLLIIAIGLGMEINRKPMSVVIISFDTLRLDHMSLYGYERNTTPNIDIWAKKAQVFTKSYTVVPLTYPSFAALMTGEYPAKTGISRNVSGYISKKFETLAEFYKKRGFKTAAFVTNAALDKDITNIARGFDTYLVSDMPVERKGIAAYLGFLGKATKWADEHKNEPIFLWIHIKTPHRPYYPPNQLRYKFTKSYTDTIEGLTIDEAKEKLETIMFKFNCSDYFDKGISDKEIKQTVDKYIDLYDEDIYYGDYLFGKIIGDLQKDGLTKKSLVVFYSDHGESFDKDYYFSHGRQIYDSSVKIPFIVAIPGQKGKKIEAMIDNISMNNIIKTLSRNSLLAKIGQNYFNLVYGINKRQKIYFADTTEARAGVTDGNFKYIKSLVKGDCLTKSNEEFYDLKKDGGENKNIISNTYLKKNIDSFAASLKENLKKYFPISSKDQYVPQERIDKLKSLGY